MRPDNMHGVACARERRGNKVQVLIVQLQAVQEFLDLKSGSGRLLQTFGIKANVLLALQAAFSIPIGFAMPQKDEPMGQGYAHRPDPLIFAHNANVGSGGVFHAHHMIASIDMQNFTRHAP